MSFLFHRRLAFDISSDGVVSFHGQFVCLLCSNGFERCNCGWSIDCFFLSPRSSLVLVSMKERTNRGRIPVEVKRSGNWTRKNCRLIQLDAISVRGRSCLTCERRIHTVSRSLKPAGSMFGEEKVSFSFVGVVNGGKLRIDWLLCAPIEDAWPSNSIASQRPRRLFLS